MSNKYSLYGRQTKHIFICWLLHACCKNDLKQIKPWTSLLINYLHKFKLWQINFFYLKILLIHMTLNKFIVEYIWLDEIESIICLLSCITINTFLPKHCREGSFLVYRRFHTTILVCQYFYNHFAETLQNTIHVIISWGNFTLPRICCGYFNLFHYL